DYGHASGDRSRFKLALQTGTYVERNLAFEPPALRPLAEAYLGFKAKQQDIWFDFGVFDSHIGFESTKGSDNDMLSRTMMAENSPYYESGMRIMYTRPRAKFGFFVLNGWQQMRRTVPLRCGPSLGTQIQWVAGAFTFNSSSFFGVLSPRPFRYIRVFHNFWMSYTSPNAKHKLTLSADAGLQNVSATVLNDNFFWGAGALVYRWNASQKWAFSVRGEAFVDPDFVIIPPASPTTESILFWGGAANIEYKITTNVVARAEVRSLSSDEPYFLKTVTNPNSILPPENSLRKNSVWTALTLSYSIPTVQLFNRNNDKSLEVEILDEK
ncbi:MAG: outer membrane beta-barrel protein, partial [Bacteroidia bacterium]